MLHWHPVINQKTVAEPIFRSIPPSASQRRQARQASDFAGREPAFKYRKRRGQTAHPAAGWSCPPYWSDPSPASPKKHLIEL